jgi:hypothetical protein
MFENFSRDSPETEIEITISPNTTFLKLEAILGTKT